MDQVVVHIGMHKTGSSSVQRTLQGYDDGRVRYADLGNENHSVAIYSLFSEDRYNKRFFRQRGLDKEQIDAYVARARERLLRELQQPREVLLISGEDISRMPTDAVQAMKAFLSQHCSKVRILAYARDPYGFASSSFQQLVKFDSREVEIPAPLYRSRFEKFFTIFGTDAVTVRPFDRAKLHRGSVVYDVLQFCGVAQSDWPEQVVNESLSDPATRLVFHFNRHGPPSTGTPRLMEARKRFVTLMGRKFRGDGFRFPPEVFHPGRIDAADVAWLKSTTGIDFDIEGERPQPDPDALTRTLETITDAERARLSGMLRRRDVTHRATATNAELLTFLFYDELARCWGPAKRRRPAAPASDGND